MVRTEDVLKIDCKGYPHHSVDTQSTKIREVLTSELDNMESLAKIASITKDDTARYKELLAESLRFRKMI